jgi:hypothetical protein
VSAKATPKTARAGEVTVEFNGSTVSVTIAEWASLRLDVEHAEQLMRALKAVLEGPPS